MPATGNPYRAFPDTDLIHGVTSGAHSLRTHFRTAVYRSTLTRTLAKGGIRRATTSSRCGRGS